MNEYPQRDFPHTLERKTFFAITECDFRRDRARIFPADREREHRPIS